MSELESKGVLSISSLDELPEGATLVIRSHGVPPEVYETCRERGVPFIDCTCPFVMKIHDIVTQLYSEGYSIVISGDPAHPESVGINGCCSGEAFFVRTAEEVGRLPGELS